MQDNSSGRSKVIGIALTVIFHVAVVVLFLGSGLTAQTPPQEEKSILIDFDEPQPDPPKPIEIAAGVEPKSPNPNPDEEIKLIQHSEAQNIGTKLNQAQEATVGDDGDVEIKEPPRKKEINKRALFSAADNDSKDTLAAQTSDRVTNALAAGHPQGNTTHGATDGEPSAKVAGRSTVGSLPLPNYSVQKSGRVVVKITVNREGKVTTAIPGYQGTTVTDKTLWESAKNAALKAIFNVNQSAPVSQEGTITYIFTLK